MNKKNQCSYDRFIAIHSKKSLFSWAFWFFLINVCLFFLAGLNYLSSLSSLPFFSLTAWGKGLVLTFLGFSYIGHLALLACLPFFIVTLLILVFPKRTFIFVAAIFLFTVSIVFFATDTVVYGMYRLHITGVILEFVLSGSAREIFDLSGIEIVTITGSLIAIFILETGIAYTLWYRVVLKDKQFAWGKWAAILFGGCLYISYSMVVFSAEYPMNRQLLDAARLLPFYENVMAILLPRQGLAALQRRGEMFFVQPEQASAPLHYPLQELQFTPSQKPLNIVMIVIDTWRFNMLNPEVTPYLSQFAKNAWNFTQHFSGANSTGPGIFTLFYGIPSTYWTSVLKEERSPVFMDALFAQHYQMGIFSSATLRMPAFHRTIFRAIKDIPAETVGNNPYEKDVTVTQEFKKFILRAKQNKQPFFSFLFYDSAHSYCAIENDLQPFVPVEKSCARFILNNESNPQPYLNRYKNALLLVDEQIRQVIETLRTQQLLDNTVVIVTGDHGEEFNDNHLNYWGHASNFTHYQVQTPLIVYWPQRTPQTFTHQTSHFDIVPTLMKDLLGCRTSPSEYSVGTDLFDTQMRPYLIVGSYIDFGVIQKDRITTIFPLGNFSVDQLNGQPIPQAKLDLPVMRDVFRDMKKFYRKKE